MLVYILNDGVLYEFYICHMQQFLWIFVCVAMCGLYVPHRLTDMNTITDMKDSKLYAIVL